LALYDKYVLITGADGPAGFQLAEAFAAEGARLALTTRDVGHAMALEPHIAHWLIPPLILPCDLHYEEDIIRTVHRTLRRFGRIDSIIHAASATVPSVPLMDHPVDPWRSALAVHVTAPFLLSREAMPWMIRQKSGSVIHLIDQAPEGPLRAARAAIIELTRQLAAEVRGTGVLVNCLDQDGRGGGGRMDGVVVEAALWLASRESGDRSGQCIRAPELVRSRMTPRPS
jgi:NAD(P)-dependent dehydrogenase (short-subunit alcohol dehydrogenase family)